MKVLKVEIMIINFDRLSIPDIVSEIENANYANDCIRPEVKRVEVKDIGEWHDNHPLNLPETSLMEYEKLFPSNQ